MKMRQFVVMRSHELEKSMATKKKKIITDPWRGRVEKFVEDHKGQDWEEYARSSSNGNHDH